MDLPGTRLAFVALAALPFFSTLSPARQGAAPPPSSAALGPHLVLPPIDAAALLEEDDEVQARGPAPLRFALPVEVFASPSADGEWEQRPDGSRAWRFVVHAPGASDLNFGFGRFRLPEGAALWLIPDGDERREGLDLDQRRESSGPDQGWEGPYTHEDNKEHGQLWTPVVAGDRVTILLLLPAGSGPAPDLELSQVGFGYRDVLGRLGDPLLPKSGACNIDVVCPEGDPWRAEIDSVAVYSTDGSSFCTGQMIMDVPRSFRNWFLTASHCGVRATNAASLVVYWNYQASTCGGPRDGRLDQNQTGSTFRARAAASDFCLVELDDDPDPDFNVYYSGWDATDTPAASTVGIHHPSADEKAITFNHDPITKANDCVGGGVDSHWFISEYEAGTTESGSSGSGLWDADTHLLIGVLSGGLADCGRPDEYDCYGRFGVAWDRGGTPDARLHDWLDPGATGERTVPGSYASATTHLAGWTGVDGCSEGAGGGNGLWEPGEEIELSVALESTGSLTGLSGVLSSLSPGVDILQAFSTWPDLPAGVTAVNDGPAFRLDLRAVDCFETLHLRLTVESNEGGPFVHELRPDVGLPLRPEVPKPILDENTTTSELVVTRSLVPTSLSVRVQLAHSFVGDLRLRLRAPDGREVLLLDRPTNGGTGRCNDDDMDVLFDDASSFDPADHCAGTTPWLVGQARPVEPLAGLAGTDVVGTWTLVVDDLAPGDVGLIDWWELVTEPALTGECRPCGAEPCLGVEISPTQLRVRKAAGGELILDFAGPVSACAEGVQVRLAASPRPLSGNGSFPDDPAFLDVSDEDLDPGAAYRHVPPAGTGYYLVVEALPGGLAGPSGHYDF